MHGQNHIKSRIHSFQVSHFILPSQRDGGEVKSILN